MTDVTEPDRPTIDETQGAMSRSFTLVIAKAAMWLLAFVMTVMMPRYLGASRYGALYLAISVSGIMSILVEFGLNSLVAREVSRRREDAVHYLVNAGLIKAGLWSLGFIVLAILGRFVDYPAQTQIAIAILAVSVLFLSESTLIAAVLQADDRIRWVAWAAVLEKVVYVGLGVTVLLMGYGVIAVAVVMLLGSVAGFLLHLWWLLKLDRTIDVRGGWRGLELRPLFVEALPFFSVLFFGAIYFRADVVVLSLLTNDTAVGYYGAAYRLFQTTYIVPEAFLFAMFPLFCRLSPRKNDELSVAAQKGLDVLLLVGLPIAVGIAVLAEPIITTLYGAEFGASIVLLRVLAVAIVLMYANGVFVQLLIATERQKRLAITAGVASAVNIVLNLLLIPVIGVLASAITTVVTEALTIALNYAFLPAELRAQLKFTAPARSLAAAGIMAVVLVQFGGIGLGWLILMGAAVYLVAAITIRALPAEDWAMVKAALANMGTS